ncbi:cysteine hydrolase family protein [Hippea maritima]|uniref:Isochorismatase hydrolase n=1 Tax=Hippea maritima (strain ATCC 700847 / DSM 10411 / MH2) TaxID=760142 RepID=F2LX87_HIPMA|nr:isochorismatase family cysteine hydrolase [Hippea maritima]AEA33145.1 isochorismatase hydrolase [Hippea maritima DSM 10411]
MKEAVLVVDMLNDFTLDSAPLKVKENAKIIPNIKALLDEKRKSGTAVIYVCDAHAEDDKEFKIWPKHCVRGSKGAEIVDELKPQEGDFIVEKTTYDGFYNTELDSLLKQLGVKKLIITGCVINICIMYTASSAVLRGYEVEIPLNCVSALDELSRQCAIAQFKNVLNVKLS